MKFYFSIAILMCLASCQSTTKERTPNCTVRAELLLPSAYGDSNEVKEIFTKRLEILYPQAIVNSLRRNGIDSDADAFSYNLEDQQYEDRIVKFYLTSYIECNCISLLDTLLYELRSSFLKRFPDNRTIQYHSKMLTMSDQLDSLQRKIEKMYSHEQILSQGINHDSIERWENELTKLMEQRVVLKMEKVPYLYEYFTVLSSGSSVLYRTSP